KPLNSHYKKAQCSPIHPGRILHHTHEALITLAAQKEDPLKLHCEVCSIVSSSGQMLGREAGGAIDQSSCIWRMNNAPTRGFEKDVGHRTDLRVVSHTSVPLLIQKPQHFFGLQNETVYVVWGPLRNMRKDGKGIVYNMLQQAVENYPHARIYVTTEERMNYCDTVFKKETGKDSIMSISGGFWSTIPCGQAPSLPWQIWKKFRGADLLPPPEQP
ncbi:hypothetical protein DNTS_028353, partial [Danionella cerebrum]